MSLKGKALVWLHKLDDDNDFEYTLFFQSGVFFEDGWWIEDDIKENIANYGEEQWHSDLKKMAPGDWVRFTIKWEWTSGESYDSWNGVYEPYSEVYTTRVRTLARGNYKERYRSKK